jgi:acyl-CoA synthetase (AMP-forming)/AMP-acid ligase II
VHTYGASEEGLVSVLTAAENDPTNPEHFHSAGRVLPHVKVRLRRNEGTIAVAGEPGSIEVRSPAMAQGYRNHPDLEAAAFRDGGTPSLARTRWQRAWRMIAASDRRVSRRFQWRCFARWQPPLQRTPATWNQGWDERDTRVFRRPAQFS